MSTVYTLIGYLVSLSFFLLLTTAQDDDLRGLKLLRDYNGAPVDVTAMKETVSSLDDDLEQYQKRTCQFGINSHHCALADLDRVMSSSEWLNSGHSPGKRSVQIDDPNLIEKYERILEDITRKRQHLAALQSMLQRVDYHLSNKQKRTCLLELGGQCRTELASAIADQYYYLNSPNSPGRRRRRSVTSLHQRLAR